MIVFRDLIKALGELGIAPDNPVIAHASLSSFGHVQGGAQTVVDALLYRYDSLVMPGFTYKTMLVPEVGPPGNGITYGRSNLMVEFYHPEMPVDRLIGVIPEALRQHPKAGRSSHPILSFVGVNAWKILGSQTIAEPLAPIGALEQANGWLLLFGVGHTTNTSLHYAERLAGRKQFLRWSLAPEGVLECPRFPGCSYGFEPIAVRLAEVTRWAHAGQAQIQAVPLAALIRIAREWIEADPSALLCLQEDCERCRAVRDDLSLQAK